MNLRWKSAAIAAAMVGGLASAAWADPVKIAGNLPLSGPVAAYSGNYFKAFELGLQDACKAQNISCDQFKLDAQDNAGKPMQALSVGQKQLLDSPTVVVSGTSEDSMAIAPLVDKAGIPHFVIAFDAYMVERGKNLLRVLPNFKVESLQYARFIDKAQPKKIVAIALNNAANNEMFEAVVGQQIKSRNIAYTHIPFDFGTQDYNSLVLKAKDLNPDLYIVSGYSFQVYPILKAIKTYGIPSDKVIVAMDFVDLLYNGTSRDELKGFYFTTPLFEVPGAPQKAQAFRARYKAQYGKEPSYVEAYAYDTAGIIVAAQAKGGKVTKETLLAVTPYDGVSGRIELDKFGDIMGTVTVAQIGPDGNVVEVK
jgi:branched-chain amino acid transport system substrate-binding protein